jgi:hypothetical protein
MIDYPAYHPELFRKLDEVFAGIDPLQYSSGGKDIEYRTPYGILKTRSYDWWIRVPPLGVLCPEWIFEPVSQGQEAKVFFYEGHWYPSPTEFDDYCIWPHGYIGPE